MNRSLPSSLFISSRCLSSFRGYIGLPACPLKTTSVFLTQDLCTCSSLFLLILASHVLRPPTKKAFLPLCCSLSPYLAPSFSIGLKTAVWNCAWTYTHTSHTPAREFKVRTWSAHRCADRSTKSVNGLWNEWPVAQDCRGFVKDVLEVFWRPVGRHMFVVLLLRLLHTFIWLEGRRMKRVRV